MTVPDAHASSVLFVCTGNVCRSPYAEHVLRRLLPDHSLRIASAGTGALVGAVPPEPIIAELAKKGAAASSHRARQITTGMLDDADLVLTAERSHTAIVVRLAPLTANRVFTIAQFRRLLAGAAQLGLSPDASAPLTDFVSAAIAARGIVAPASDTEDIPDPWGRSQRVYHRTMQSLDEELRPLAKLLAFAT